ncbi:phosphoglycolate phosphatase [Nitrosomonas sp.]|uniref:phosphoglycolate phosphatase n=1 Tax=Nitrosomonas sp. TaxID=42353 RepID=UPI0025EA8C18|nr:phosphoglycolate phosphatase [Nitrosomonas sp.]
MIQTTPQTSGSTSFPLSLKAVIIDLDGTLLDTAQDLALAANEMLRELRMTELPASTIQTFIGKGVPKLVKRTLTNNPDGEPDPELFEQALPIYERCYAENLHVHTRPYPGVIEGLDRLKEEGFRLVCITNKTEIFTLPLLRKTGLLDYFELVLSGDSLPKRKPDPLPLLHACQHFGITPRSALLIGDSLNDAIAARAAGCHIFCVPYGYNEGHDVRTLDCDAVVDTIVDATRLITYLRDA